MRPENVLLITDPNSDPDDLACMILLKMMMQQGMVNLCGVVAAKGEFKIRELRAKFAKAALNLLELPEVEVAVGGDYQRRAGTGDNAFCFAEEVSQLLDKPADVMPDAKKMMENILHKYDEITLLIVSPMNDVADFIDYNPELCKAKIRKIIIMGGCKDDMGCPDEKPHNNAVCYEAAVKLWQFAVDFQIPLIWMPRESVYQVQVRRDFYERLEKLPHLLAKILLVSNKKLLEMLWEDIHCGVFSHFDIKRFAKVFMGSDFGNIKKYEDFSSVWRKLKFFNMYDAAAALVLDKELCEQAFELEACRGNKNVLTVRIKDAAVIRNRLYDGIVGQLERIQKGKTDD